MPDPMQSRYRILGRIGAGGMGVVYRAEDVALKRSVALKVLPQGAFDRDEALLRFHREARAAAALNHPNICTIYEVGEVDREGNPLLGAGEHLFPAGTPFIAMEYVEGRTLRSMVADGPLPIRDAVRAGIEIASGLSAAHQAGITHRDLKPDNVVVGADGHVKILDFGVAKLRDEEGTRRPSSGDPDEDTASVDTTIPGGILGSAAYMSPEQARGLPVDGRSDIFSLGIVLYELVAGKRPFHGATRMDTISAIIRDPAAPASRINRAVDPALDEVLRRCLEKDPERRYATAAELRSDLMKVLDDLPGAAIRRRRRRLTAAGGIVAALLTLAAGLSAAVRLWRSPAASGPGRIESLAVLPLSNLSGDPGQDFFADGMTESLIADLAQIRALRVISRTSVMRYKDGRRPLPEIARELHVDAIVEGSVLRSGGRVRITAQLIQAATDQHIWARSYERDLKDVLALQSEVARAIAREIRIAVTPREQARLTRARPIDPALHELYLRGRYEWNRRNEEGLRKGLEFFQKALDRDPSEPLAYAGLADSYDLLGFYSFMPWRQAYAKAKAAASKALEIDDSLSEAHASLGYALFYLDWDWEGAEREYMQAIDLNPGYATVHHWYALYLTWAGRTDEALRQIRTAQELDPLSTPINAAEGWILYFARRYDQAAERCRQILDVNPDFYPARWALGQVYVQQGEYGQAVAQFTRIGLSPISIEILKPLASKERDEALREADLLARSAGAAERPRLIAANYAVLSRKEETLLWLEKALDERDSGILDLKADPVFDALRSDPRFGRIMKRVGVPP